MKPGKFVAALLVVLFAGAGASFAALSPANAAWANGPAQYYMSKDELKQSKSLKTDEEAEKFISLFWARRDSTPGTPRNEFKERFEDLVKFADQNYTTPKAPGSMTERGRAMVLLGVPSRVRRSAGSAAGQSGFSDEDEDGGGGAQTVPRELWVYEGDKVPAFLGVQSATLEFSDRFSTGDFRLSKSNVPDWSKKAIAAALTQPDLKEAPSAAQPRVLAQKQIPASEIKVASSGITTQSLVTAVEQIRAAAKNPYKDAHVTFGEFVTPAGDYYVPVQIYLSKGSDIPAEGVTFFASLADAEGKPVLSIEEPAKFTDSKGDRFFDRTLTIAPGKYSGVFGLSKDGTPLVASRTDVDVKPLEKAGFSTSRMILSNNVYALPAAQEPTDPYAFGGLKVVPKGDSLFVPADEIWYFVELRNPGLDSTTNQPKVQVKIDVEGKTVKGKTVKLGAPLEEVPAQELKGVSGHYAVGSSLELSTFAPGDYTFKVKLIDTILKQTQEYQQAFKIVEGAK